MNEKKKKLWTKLADLFIRGMKKKILQQLWAETMMQTSQKKWMANELDDDSLNKKEKDSSIERKKLNLKNKIAKPKKDAYIMANKQTNQRKKKNRNKYER